MLPVRLLWLGVIALPVALSGCCNYNDGELVSAKQPVYTSFEGLLEYAQLPPQPGVNAGKVLLYNNYLFLGEVNAGIHIFDMSDTLNPLKISYLKIPGTKDFSAQNNRLYADNGPHLLILDISDIHHVTIISRKLNYFQPSEYYPPDYSGPFECADYTKGWVTGWKTALVTDPKCTR